MENGFPLDGLCEAFGVPYAGEPSDLATVALIFDQIAIEWLDHADFSRKLSIAAQFFPGLKGESHE